MKGGEDFGREASKPGGEVGNSGLSVQSGRLGSFFDTDVGFDVALFMNPRFSRRRPQSFDSPWGYLDSRVICKRGQCGCFVFVGRRLKAPLMASECTGFCTAFPAGRSKSVSVSTR